MNGHSWIFFAGCANPAFMQRALAERLAEKEPVVIIDRPLSIFRYRRIPPLRERYWPIRELKDFWEYRPLHYPVKFPGLRGILRVLNLRSLQRELDELFPRETARIVCYDSPTQDHIVGELRESLSVYLAIDDRTITVRGESISGEIEAEKRLLRKVDRVICVSEPLAQTLKSRTSEGQTPPIFVLPNGYDERIFDPSVDYPEPDFLKDIPRPRILIAGHVSERIDWDGIAGASLLRPDWTWIFLGSADRGMEEKLRNLLDSHAVMHPSIPVDSVPAWIRHSDACAVPYRLNRFTLASHPLKAIEYLAMGAPVLSTRIPSLESYHGGIEWVEEGDGRGYAKVLDALKQKEMQQKLKEIRRNIVKQETWGIRIAQFRQIILSGMKKDLSNSFLSKAPI